MSGSGTLFEIPAVSGGEAEFWLDGNVVLCACPDCSAPMTVRHWLMTADCWRCGASIELTEEQEREVERLLAERVEPPPVLPKKEIWDLGFRIWDSEAPVTSLQSRIQNLKSKIPRLLRKAALSFASLPAWLISMLLHMVMLAILALLLMEWPDWDSGLITLSTVRSGADAEGGDLIGALPSPAARFDLPLPSKGDPGNKREWNALIAAAQDARELRLAEGTPNLPDIKAVKSRIGRADGFEFATAGRDPRLRAEIVTREGGTTLTEAAVARGLRWLANHQNDDGSWSLKGFQRAGDCNCTGDGAYTAKSPGTALALLPFLGAGQTHLAGKYQGRVGRGLRWLIEHQKEDGDLRAGANGNEGMYTHGQAAIVLCEAFAMTGDEELRGPAQKAIEFIEAAQYDDGGWRYRPGPARQRGDTSVVGWQLMALQSARAARLRVIEETWERADVYLDGVSREEGAQYSYQAHGDATATMTAEALLCRIYLGWTKERPGLVFGTKWLMEEHPPAVRESNIYYWYYATQVMHHYGGREWREWNLRMRDILVNSQETRGHAAGSWSPRGEHAGAGGRIYMTALATCSLEVYYRHLPIFRRIEVK